MSSPQGMCDYNYTFLFLLHTLNLTLKATNDYMTHDGIGWLGELDHSNLPKQQLPT